MAERYNKVDETVTITLSEYTRLVKQETDAKYLKNAIATGIAAKEVTEFFTGRNSDLERYRETGLTPEQIREIDRLYAEQCKQVACLKARQDALEKQIKGYEETGLTPEQIKRVSRVYAVKLNNEELKKILEGGDATREEMRVRVYQEKARRTVPDYKCESDKLYHAVFGLNSEAGEVAGILQKKYQGHDVSINHLVKELGDCLWMISEACDALGVDMESVMKINIRKLEERYPDGFDVNKSLHRKAGDE